MFRVLIDFEFLLKAIKCPIFHIVTFTLRMILFSKWLQDDFHLVQEYFIFLCRWKIHSSAYKISNNNIIIIIFHILLWSVVLSNRSTGYLFTALTNETFEKISLYILVICLSWKNLKMQLFSHTIICKEKICIYYITVTPFAYSI